MLEMEKRKITKFASVVPFIVVCQQSEADVEGTNVFYPDAHKSPFEPETVLKAPRMREVPLCRDSLLPPMFGERVCSSNGGDRSALEPDPVAIAGEEHPCENGEAEADDEPPSQSVEQ